MEQDVRGVISTVLVLQSEKVEILCWLLKDQRKVGTDNALHGPA